MVHVDPVWVAIGIEWGRLYGSVSFKVFCEERHLSRYTAERHLKRLGYVIRRPREWNE
jgi:hypothetical protein